MSRIRSALFRLAVLALSFAPVLRAQIINPATTGWEIKSSSYVNANDLAKWSYNATFTASSGAVVLQSTDPPFLCPGGSYPCTSGGDIGKVCFGTDYTGTMGYYQVHSVIMHEGTISSITDARHATCSTTSSSSTTGTFVWGNFVDTGLTNWWSAMTANANAPCKSGFLSDGGYLVKNGNFNSVACGNQFPVYSDNAVQVDGAGMRTVVIIPAPDSFNYTTCTGLQNSCFFGVDGIRRHDIAISGMGHDEDVAAAHGLSITYIGCDGDSYNLDVYEWGANDTGTFYGYTTSNCGGGYYDINDEGAGSIALFLNNGRQQTYMSYFCCTYVTTVITSANTIWQDHDSGFAYSLGVVAYIYGEYYLDGTIFSGNYSGGNFTIGLQDGSHGTLTNGAGCRSQLGNAHCLYSNGGGGTATAEILGAHLEGAGNGSPIAFYKGSLFDGGYNTTSGGLANFVNSPAKLYGDASITGIADVVGNHVLSTSPSWGTASVTAVGGATTFVTFTVTVSGGTPAANPYITDTFATAFEIGGLAPSAGCSLIQTAGNFGDITNPVPSSLSATGVVWTFSGTPVSGHNYTFQRVCKNP